MSNLHIPSIVKRMHIEESNEQAQDGKEKKNEKTRTAERTRAEFSNDAHKP